MKLNLYRNLNPAKGVPIKWSVREKGLIRDHAVTVTAYNCKANLRVDTKHFQDCLAGGKRRVFAWLVTEQEVDINHDQVIPTQAKRIRFNPKDRKETAFLVDGQPKEYFEIVWLTESGEAYTI